MFRKLLTFAVAFMLLAACALPFTQDRAVVSVLDRYEQAYIEILGNTENLSEDRKTMESALKRVKYRYVDVIDLNNLVDEAIKGLRDTENSAQPPTTRALNTMLASLDPYSGYMDPKAYKRYQESLDGRFVGFGFRIEMRDRKLTVITPLKGSSAEEAGILPNDVITHLNGESLAEYSFPDAIAKLRGPEGSRAILTIQRSGIETLIKIGLARRALDLEAVEYRVDGDIGYIRIHTFNRKTGDSVEEALDHFDDKLGENLCGVILDMRNNPGGLVTAAVSVADQFMETGNIFAAINRGKSFSDEDAVSGDRIQGRPILIMLNKGSASAAEIVAGALQNQKRARVFGQQSYGKGTMQTLYDLDNGGGMRLTTGRFTAGGGASFNGTGLTPDIRDAVIKGENSLAPLARAGGALNCTVSAQTAAADITS